MDLPESLKSRLVTGQFLVGVIDGRDTDKKPDGVPAAGSVTFTASIPYLPVLGGAGSPATVALASIKAILDSRGILSTPDPSDLTGQTPLYEGAALFTTDNPSGSVTGWTWTATFRFAPVNGVHPTIPAVTFSLPDGDSPVDLGTLVKVPSSPGIGMPQAFAMLAEAKAAAIAAQAAAEAAANNGGGAGTTLYLDPAQAIPAGTAANTLIVRRGQN